ncbi:ketoacyl-synt-domain-containing protein [Amylocystis lapponica]|nr:ketoacyl-synt-domain-containing protein [Amylocystis lapponica]
MTMYLHDGPSAPIAIVGIAAQLPSGRYSDQNLDYHSFFQFLLEKGEAYETIPRERFNVQSIRGSGLGQVITDTGAFLKDVHLFDNLEFGITDRDARLMPVGTRKLIETAFLSLVDSGLDYRGKNVGCYVSGVAHDMLAVSGHDDSEARGSFAFAPAMVANRISYHLDLRGPSIPMDTACSSSLSATHLAVQALRTGDCEAAVVGGSQINHRFAEWLLYTQGGVLSPDGKCKPFDASADGFGRGEGVVSVVLKPLDSAERDHDHIYGTILGTGVNSSGSLAPVSAPVASAQQDAMTRAFAQAKCRPQDVDFIELHATGTKQGDPTEANWVGAQFKRDEELIIGSVKGNIGHLEITSFLASLCKVCSIFETGLIPPNTNFNNANPTIKWEDYKFRVPLQAEPLPCHRESGRALIAMTSSGIGGANGHCVVEGPPKSTPVFSSFWRTGEIEIPSILIAGGLSPRSASTVAGTLKEYVPGRDVQMLSRIYGRRSRSMPWRSFTLVGGDRVPRFAEPKLVPRTSPPVVFVFCGQGTQHIHMGRELFRTSTVFRASVLEMDEIHRRVTGESLIERTGLFEGTPQEEVLRDIWPIAIILPAIAMLQIALVDTFASAGVKPDAVIGHSAGEAVCFYTSGAGSRAMAFELSVARGKAVSLLESLNGTMAAVSCSPEEVKPIIAEVIAELGIEESLLEIGCYNTPDAVSLTGSSPAIDLLVQKAEAAGFFARRLRTDFPSHGSMADFCQQEYLKLMDDVFARHPVLGRTASVYSTVTGKLFEDVYDVQYFWRNVRRQVFFTQAMEALVADHPNAVYVEMSPHPTLARYVSAMAGKGTSVMCPLRRQTSPEPGVEVNGFLECLGKLATAGYNGIDFDALCGTAGNAGELTPPYPFTRKEVPYLADTPEIARQKQQRHGPLNFPQLRVNAKTHPGIADHVIKGEPIMPAAGYIEMALEFGARKLWNIEFVSILGLSAQRPTPVEVKLEGSQWSINSAIAGDITKTWPLKYNQPHARGYLSFDHQCDHTVPNLQLDEISARLKPIDMNGFYDGFLGFAEYGSTYQRIVACSRGFDACGQEEILVQLRGADEDLPDITNYRFHPAVLDAAVHIVVHPLVTGNADHSRYYLPSGAQAFIVHDALVSKPFPRTIYSYIKFSKWTPDSLVYDFTIVDEEGVCLCTLEGLEVSAHGHSIKKLEDRCELVQQPISPSIAFKRDGDIVNPLRPSVQGTNVVKQDQGPPSDSPDRDSGYNTRNASNESITPAMHVQSSKCSSEGSSPTLPPPLVVEYARGTEMDIQKLILGLDPLSETSIWFTASAGLDGDASVGFTRSLRKEYRTWTIRVAVFDLSWTTDQRMRAVRYLSSEPECEVELFIDADGSVSVPRIVSSTAPEKRVVFDPNCLWKLGKTGLVQMLTTPSVPEDHVLVRVVGTVDGPGRLWAFSGHTDGVSGLVFGLATGALSNAVVVHKGSLLFTDLPLVDDTPPVGLCVLAFAIAVLAVGTASFAHPERLRKTTVLVTHSDTYLGRQIVDLYKLVGLDVLTLPAQPSLADLQRLFSNRPNVIVSGSQDASEIRILDDLVSQRGKVFLWDHSERGFANVISTDPWAVGDALQCAYRSYAGLAAGPLERFVPPLDLLDATKKGTMTVASEMFSPEASYLLVGGIGSLGLQIALWMYKRGAREIILTSRTGRANLAKRAEFMSLRYLAYLEALPDLVLRVEAVDATSPGGMKDLINSLKKPLAGCMILTAVLIDGTFASQTKETFEAPHTAKVRAFEVLESVVEIDSLDFLVAFSSVSGLLGNAGQTNYASANTALTGLTRKYRRAMTMVSPLILDTGITVLLTSDSLQHSRLKHLSRWGLTTSELCDCLEDAIRKLRQSPVWHYIPAFDWSAVRASMGPSAMYDDLVVERDTQDNEVKKADSSLKGVVCRVLDIAETDLLPDVPFTTYGLDSLSAASLSYALRPIMTVSQIQLLANLTLNDLESRLPQQAM